MFFHDIFFNDSSHLAGMIRKEDVKILRAFGKALRENRRAKKMSIRDLEAASEIDRALIGKYELGQVNPTISTVYRLAAALEIHPRELLP